MRVLFLTKQQYMGKDLLRDRFGRFYEFPKALAHHGHHVRGVCLKYWRDGLSEPVPRQQLDGVDWQSFHLGWNMAAGFFHHHQRLKTIAKEFSPDVIVGVSDSMHVILASTLAATVDAPAAIDLYDDFESYRATRLPGMRRGLKRGILGASGISTVSSALAAKIASEYRAPGIIRPISNAVCPETFQPMDKRLARRKLGLPESGSLIGTAGALSVERGTKTLLLAFAKLSRKRGNLHFVLAGRLDRRLPLPPSGNVRYMGELSQTDVGCLFNALDVGIVSNRRTQFAEYCFPQKFYEMIACKLPIVAAEIGAMSEMLAGHENCRYQPDSVDSLVGAIEKQLDTPTVLNIPVPTWKDRGADFLQLLLDAFKRRQSLAIATQASGE
jgi:glycosyltransferase involved in cell wall biosynthesis